MRLRTFEAPTMQAALARMRDVMGPDAVIVASREEAGLVRLTAAVDTVEPDLDTLLAPPGGGPVRVRVEAALRHHGLEAAAIAALLGAAPAGDPGEPEALLSAALAGRYRLAGSAANLPGALLLVGPPGSGKTAIAARLAAMSLLEGRKVEVRSADCARAGGLDQLRALLAPMGLVPEPVGADLREPPTDRRLVIDGPGVNPFRRTEMVELAATVRRLAVEPVLVLPAGLDPADSGELAANFQVMGVRRMITSRLDAARRLGGLLAAAELGLELAWATTGPEIGRPLVPWTAAGLARLLLARAPRPMGETP